MSAVLEKRTLLKDDILSIVNAMKIEVLVPRRNHFLISEKTGSRQFNNYQTHYITNNRYL